MRCYRQSWYKYRICVGARVLICRDLRDRVVDGGGWSDSHTGGPRPIVAVNNTSGPKQHAKLKNLGENFTRFSNRL